MKLLTFGAVTLATLILVLVYLFEGRVDLAALAVTVSLIWLTGIWRGWEWSAYLGFVALLGVAALGAGLGMLPMGMLVAVIATLIAWDLHRFLFRVGSADYVIDALNLQRIHLNRLAIVAGVGLALGILALTIELNLGLGWIILMGLIVAIGLSWIVGFVKRSEKA